MSTEHQAILIPGGGLQPNGTLPPWSFARLDQALKFFSGTQYLIPLSAGTVHKPPPLDQQGFPILESIAAANYLISKGINPEFILPETVSLDTIGNAYFARTIHTDPLQLSKLTIVTSDFHLNRVKEIFSWVFTLKPLDYQYQLEFTSSPDTGLSSKTLELRLTREKQSLQQLLPLTKQIQTMPDFHHWLFSKHQAYAVGIKPDQIKGTLLNSY